MNNSTQLFLVIAMVFLTSIIVITTMVSYEKEIENLQEQIIEKDLRIDSLCNEIDTLEWETQIWDFNIKLNTTMKKVI